MIDPNVEGWHAVFAKIEYEGTYEETFLGYGLEVNNTELTAAISKFKDAVSEIDRVLNNHGWNNGDWETGDEDNGNATPTEQEATGNE